jgi:hypothetical protein
MGNVTEEKENKRLNQIVADLKKKVRSFSSDPDNFTNVRFTEWLSHEIQKTAKVYLDANSKAIPFSELEKIAKNELVEYNTINPSSKFKYSKKQVVEALSWLTDVGAILIGYELICPSCLNKEWRALDDVGQIIECRGCGYEYTFFPETKIKYKLNTVLENGIRLRGVVPVVLALGSIFRDARHYFDFMPPVDIFKKGKKLTDLDICCVIDGQFVIGEVKARHGLFHPSDFKKIADIAKEIHPNKVVFCSLDERIPQRRKDQVDEVKNELTPLGITVEWLYFDPWIYKASPIY